jgi:L-threonylcarbamoyladenylate synthase
MDTKKAVNILNKGGIGILATDTIYGIVGQAVRRKTVERIYGVKGRNPKKPFIILISSIAELKKFNIQHPYKLEFVRMLDKVWPGKVSIIFPCPHEKFSYLHRGTKALAFRLPNKKSLINILKKTGPLVAPSANPEGLPPAINLKEAKKYFGENIDFYLAGGTVKGKPSKLVKIIGRNIVVIRK